MYKRQGVNATIELWDMNTRTLKNTIQKPVNAIAKYFFVPNTSLLVIVGEESVVFWDLYKNSDVLAFPLQCFANAVNTNRNGSVVILSGTIFPQVGENQVQQTSFLTLNQTLIKAFAELSFEQVFIIARALYGMHIGTPLDLTNSPDLLAIFNQIDPMLKTFIEQCFKIKTN